MRTDRRQFAAVAGLAGPRVAGLANRDDVDGGVELAVARSGQAMAAAVSAGRFDGGGAAVAGEVVLAGEAGHVAAVSEDLCGEDSAEAVDLGERAAVVVDCSRQLPGAGFDLVFRCGGRFTEDVAAERFALDVSGRDRAERSEELAGLQGAQVALGAAGCAGRAAACGAGSRGAG